MAKLLAQWELRQKKSRYFQPKRTQPFIILFMSAIIAFKRLAKSLKNKVVMIRKQQYLSSSKRDYLELEIVRANTQRLGTRFGATAISMTNIKPKQEAVTMYRDADTGIIFEGADAAHSAEMRSSQVLRRPFIPRATKVKKVLQKKVKNAIEKYENDMALGNHEISLRNLKRRINRAETRMVSSPDRAEMKKYMLTLRERERLLSVQYDKATHHALDHDSLTGGASVASGGMPQQQGGAAAAPLLGGGAELREMYIEYMKGTEIYYGSAVSLQAKHGGFLSFNDKTTIRASAHKQLPQARFVILKSSDLGNKNVVRYGDAVWLQAGHHEVLGATFSGNITAGKGRTLCPALVSSRRNVMFKAQQYGRWIIINRADPVGTIGKTCLHQDDILLEQEWYYLASRTPSDSFMSRITMTIDQALSKNEGKARAARSPQDGGVIGSALDAAVEAVADGQLDPHATANSGSRDDNKEVFDDDEQERNRVDFFSTGDDCVWSICLVGIATTDGSKEGDRAVLLSKASEQIKDSGVSRRRAATNLLTSLRTTMPAELEPDSLRGTMLEHKQTAFLKEKAYMDKFSKLSAKGFTYQPSIKFIENLYGTDSLIYKSKKEVQMLRDKQIGIEAPPVEWVDVVTHNRLEIAGRDYWNKAQKVLVPTQSWVQLDAAMRPFYHIDFKKKVHAAKIMQRMIRKFIRSRWRFDREFARVDTETLVRRQKKLMVTHHALSEEDERREKHRSNADEVKDQEEANLRSDDDSSSGPMLFGPDDGAAPKMPKEVDQHRHRLKRHMSTADLSTTTEGHMQTMKEKKVHTSLLRGSAHLQGTNEDEEQKQEEEEAKQEPEVQEQEPEKWDSTNIEELDRVLEGMMEAEVSLNDLEEGYGELEAKKNGEDDFFITRGKSHRLIKISDVENDILAEVHEKDRDPMWALYTPEERRARLQVQHQEDHEHELAKINGRKVGNSGIVPLPAPSTHLRRGMSDVNLFSGTEAGDLGGQYVDDGHGGKSSMKSVGGGSYKHSPGRPGTAPQPSPSELRRAKRDHEQRREVARSKSKLGLSATNPAGLPAEVFDDWLEPVTAHTGIKFLRTQSHLTCEYSDVRMHRTASGRSARRPRPGTSGATDTLSSAGFDKSGLGERPSTSSAAAAATSRSSRRIPGQRVDMHSMSIRPNSSPHASRSRK